QSRVIVPATKNAGKIKEIQDMMRDLPVTVRSLADFPDVPDVEEDGATFAENALKKARAISQATGLTAMADDSGLCVDALGGRPGVLSARYGGHFSSDMEKCLALLEELRDIPDEQRTARFVCVIALVDPTGRENVFEGTCEGIITREPHGGAGFGYDPVFYCEPLGCTFAELTRAEKNRVSHRGMALRAVGEYLKHEGMTGAEG
ncbi:MAG: XTP/dITP diphosphatase, partial [Pseudomonadota bacterium]